jgi:hypothetical protein
VPVPPGDPGRIVVRAATSCGGHWYLSGGVGLANGETRPAIWTGTDGRSWTPLPVAASTYYGKLNIIYTLACKDGVLAAVGARSGGAHGNPRVSSWRLEPTGVLTEVIAGFELYGGPNAVTVSRMTSGPRGFMITGNRVSGPAVWTSPDAREFTLHEGVKPLANEPDVDAAAIDVLATGAGWVVVGGGTPSGRIDRDPMVWSSSDGDAWSRVLVKGTQDYEELQRVVAVGDDLVAIGVRGGTFGAWYQKDGNKGPGGNWETRGAFGNTRPPAIPGSGPARVPGVLSVAANGGLLLVTVSDSQRYRLYASNDLGRTWTEAAPPAEQQAGSDAASAVATADGRWLYLADDAKAGRVGTAAISR